MSNIRFRMANGQIMNSHIQGIMKPEAERQARPPRFRCCRATRPIRRGGEETAASERAITPTRAAQPPSFSILRHPNGFATRLHDTASQHGAAHDSRCRQCERKGLIDFPLDTRSGRRHRICCSPNNVAHSDDLLIKPRSPPPCLPPPHHATTAPESARPQAHLLFPPLLRRAVVRPPKPSSSARTR